MNDVHTTVARKLRSAAQALRADVESTYFVNLRRALLAEVEAIENRADSIEEQVKPAIEEPREFGSIVRAGYPSQPPHIESPLWQRSLTYGEHYWESEYKDVEVWSELTDVEVLRVGLGAS